MATDAVNQMRLSMRLDTYLREYTGKNSTKDTLSSDGWDAAWQIADSARVNNDLTPQLVDDVRIELKKL